MKLYKHQEDVLELTKNRNRVGYFLDMGLGKTYVGSEKMIQINNVMNLLICQKSKIKDWTKHFEDNYWKKNLIVKDLTNPKQFKEFMDVNTFIQTDEFTTDVKFVGIINYELAWRRKDLLKLNNFTLMLDESSLIQNSKAKQTKFILKLNANAVILLSGTCVSGKYENLYSQANLLGWEIKEKTFLDQYVNWKKIDVGGQQIKVVDKDNPYKNVERLKRKLGDHGAIFMKTEEVFDLPEKIFVPVKVERSNDYKNFIQSKVLTVEDEELVGDTSLTKRLCERKLCGMYSKEKLQAFEDLITSTNENLVVFYNFTNELMKLKEICERNNRIVGIINGQHKDDPEGTNILLIQYQAGAMGLNLQDYSNKIIYFSIPDKSELWEQSQKRIHRIGQNKSCFYYVMLVKNSVETNEILPTLKIRKEYLDELFKNE